MSGNESLDPKANPFGCLGQAYFNNLDAAMKNWEPAVRGAGRWNLEVMSFVSRRAQAWLEIPARLSRCKTPQDVLAEQLRFWQTAGQQYAEGAHRLTAAFGAVPGLLNGAWGGQAASQSRDYISFPEPKETESAERKRGERRAA